jgi:hypothetical protein
MASKVRLQLRFDSALPTKADAVAKRQGIWTAWLHRATFDALSEFGSTVEGSSLPIGPPSHVHEAD